MFFEAASLALQVGGLFSARKQRKEEQRRIRREASKQRRAGQLAEDDLFAEASANDAQRRLLVEREALAEKASDESLRQSRIQAQSAEFEVGGTDPRARTAKRRRFFDTGDGGVL